jgi:hypothetical protein
MREEKKIERKAKRKKHRIRRKRKRRIVVEKEMFLVLVSYWRPSSLPMQT